MAKVSQRSVRAEGKKDTDKTTIACTWGLKRFLDRHGKRNESDEDVLWKLLSQSKPKQEVVKDAKESKTKYETKL